MHPEVSDDYGWFVVAFCYSAVGGRFIGMSAEVEDKEHAIEWRKNNYLIWPSISIVYARRDNLKLVVSG